MLPRFSETADGFRFRVRLEPRGRRDRIEGWVELPYGPVLKARVTAAPVNGEANAALIALIAKAARVPKSSVRIAAGQSSRIKTVEVSGEVETLLKDLS